MVQAVQVTADSCQEPNGSEVLIEFSGPNDADRPRK